MSQTTPLSDALLNNPSTVGGLLSQFDAALDGDSSSNNIFSNLLSQNGNVQTNISANPPVTAQASTQTSTTNTATNTSGDATSSALQNLSDLSSKLHQILNVLRQQNNSEASTKSATTQSRMAQDAATQATTPLPTSPLVSQKLSITKQTATVSGQDTTSTSTDTTSPSSTPDITKTVADILAELLLLTQMMMKNLHQTQVTTGGISATQNMTNTTGMTDTSSGSAASDPLLQLIALLEKTVQVLEPVLASATQDASSGTITTSLLSSQINDLQISDLSKLVSDLSTLIKQDTAATTQATAAKDAQTVVNTNIIDQLTNLDTGLKTVFTDLRSQQQANNSNKTFNTAEQNFVAPLPAVTPEVTPDLPAMLTTAGNASTNINNVKTAVTQDTTSKQAAVSSSTTTTTQTTGTTTQTQTFAASDNFLTFGQKNNDTDFSSGSNTSSQDQAASAGTVDMNVTAEGAQVAGTYGFASTLSALRATNGGLTGLPSVVDQVILQMNRSVKSGNDQMSIQLQPGDLGKITVKLDFSGDGKVQGTVTSDNPQTLSMLQKDSRSLERALQDAGLRADPGSLQFNLGGQAGNQAGQTPQNTSNTGLGTGTNSADGNIDETGLIDIGTLAETYYITPNGVNIQV